MIEYVDDCDEVLSPGDHVAYSQILYMHHCIYVGNGLAVHLTYSGVEEDLFEQLVGKFPFWVIEHDNAYSPEIIVERARSKMHEKNDYNIIFNNCEHFCEWACTGFAWSHQVFGTLGMGLLLGPLGHILGQISNDGGCQKYKLRL